MRFLPPAFCMQSATGGLRWSNLVQFIADAFARFPSSEDLRRNRLDGGLTRLQPAPTPDKYEENTIRDAIAAACATAVPGARWR